MARVFTAALAHHGPQGSCPRITLFDLKGSDRRLSPQPPLSCTGKQRRCCCLEWAACMQCRKQWFLKLSKGKWLALQTWHSLRLRGNFFRAKKRKFYLPEVGKHRKFTFLVELELRLVGDQQQYWRQSYNRLVMKTGNSGGVLTPGDPENSSLGSCDAAWCRDGQGIGDTTRVGPMAPAQSSCILHPAVPFPHSLLTWATPRDHEEDTVFWLQWKPFPFKMTKLIHYWLIYSNFLSSYLYSCYCCIK